MKYKNLIQRARKKYLMLKPLSVKEKAFIEKDFSGKDYIYYRMMNEVQILIPEGYTAESTFSKIERRIADKPTRYVVQKSIAAVFVIFVVACGLYYVNIKQEIFIASTSYGEKKQYELPDGSVIVLNSLSTVSYREKKSEDLRELVLEGEAYLEVVKDLSRPFVVNTNQLSVKVLGTKFNISAYKEDEQIVTSLYEGAVMIELYSGEEFRLQSGECVMYDKSLNGIKIQNIDEQHPDWTECSLCFKQTPLKEICKVLEREFNVAFEISDRVNSELKITASFKSGESIEDILHILSLSGNFRYSKMKDKFIIDAIDQG